MPQKPTREELQRRIQELEQAKEALEIRLTTAVNDDLIRNEALFRGLFDNMSSGSAIYEVINDGSKGSDYIIRGFNQTSLKLEGKTLDEVVGKSLFDLRPNIDDYGLIPVMRKVWETGKPAFFPIKIYKDEKFSNYYENYVFKIPSGEVVTVYNDVTEQKNAERLLAESETRYRALFDWNPIQTVVVNETGEITMFNFAKKRSTGRIPSVGDVMYKDYAAKHGTDMYKELMDSIRTGNKKTFSELPYKERFLNVQIAPFTGGAIITSQDVTEKKKLQAELQQAQKMEAIGNLAGGIAHEFNNVLGIILGNAELAMDDVPDWSPAKESLKEIRTASFRAKEVVRQILSFARKTMTALKPLEINAIVKESLKLMRASIPTMIEIRSKIPADPKMILGDPTEIHQIVINLCTNAAHAMKNGNGVLEIGISEVTLDERSASRFEDLSAGDFIKLTVKDSGEGMAPEVLDKVFEPYFTTKEFGAGSGMGLSVVYGIVKKCGGAVKINSQEGEGTTVEVLFPKIEKEAPTEEGKNGRLPTGDERILLVDDDPSIVMMLRRMLEQLGYTVSGMDDSKAALERFQSTPDDFDVVITDMSMPKMSGDQLAAEMIRIRKDVPILLCTGHSDAIDEQKAKEMGIKGFIMKPLDTGKLARAVRGLLE